MRYFNYCEFDSPDELGSGHNMDEDFLQMLDDAREFAGVPFKITSVTAPRHKPCSRRIASRHT